MRRTIIIGTVAAIASLGLMAPVASAKGGGNGGGGTGGGGGGGTTTTTSVGAISSVSGSVTCSSGTVLSITLRKGVNKRVEIVVTPTAGGTNPDGTPAPSAWWDQGVRNESVRTAAGAATSIGAWGGNVNLVPGLRQTVGLGTVPVGVSQLTYWAERRSLPSLTSLDLAQIQAQPVAETCSGSFTVVGK